MPVNGKNPLSYVGVRAPLPPNVITAQRDPVGTDVNFVIGDLWVNEATATSWQLTQISAGVAVWTATGSGAAGGVVTLTGDDATPESPLAGNIDLLGTADQITTTGSANTITWSLPAAIIAPGSLTTTTSLVSGTTITATDGAITASAGFIYALGGDLRTNMDLSLEGATSKILITSGAATNSLGTTTLVAGVSPDIANTDIGATDVIIIQRADINGSTAIGTYDYAITPATKFVITARKTDGTTETNDVSDLSYFILRPQS